MVAARLVGMRMPRVLKISGKESHYHWRLTEKLTSKASGAILFIMLKVKVSSKRQVTFPKQVCESLGIQSGDEILLERDVKSNQEIWYLKPAREETRSWLGSLREYASNKSHSMGAVRDSIARGRSSKRS